MRTTTRGMTWTWLVIAALAVAPGARAGFAPYPYSEGFETSVDTNYWALQGSWGVTTETNHAGSRCLTDSPTQLYGANTDSSATLGVDLRFAVKRPMLSFWQINALQDGVDYGLVEVSGDQGASWTRLAATTGNSMLNWFQVKVDLSAYVGTQVLIRFRLKTNESYQYDGWYIDDIEVKENPTVFAYPFYDGMNTGASQANWLSTSWQLVTGSATNPATGMSYLCAFGGAYQPGGLPVNIAMTLAGTFNFTSVVNPKLSFWFRAGTQQENTLYSQISVDGGKNWSTLWSWGSYWRNSAAWNRVQLDLNPYAGYTNVTFRFIAYNPTSRDLALDFQIDEVLIDEAPLDVTLTVDHGADPRHSAVLNWTATAVTDFGYYALYRSTNANVNPSTAQVVTTISNRLNTAFQDTSLNVVGLTYYYRLVVFDGQGLHNWGTNEVSYTTRYGQLITSLPFSEGFEGTDANWSMDPPWAFSTELARTGTKGLASNPGVNYAAGTDASAYLNVDLNRANRPVLTFWHRYGLEPNRDYGFVEAWLGGWTRLYAVTGQSGTNWTKVQIDLAGYAGAQVLLRFRLLTDGANQYNGWHVDDVSIQDFGNVSFGNAFYDSMDTASTLTNWIASAWQQVPSSLTTNGTNMGWRCQIGNGYQPGFLGLNSSLTLAGSLNLTGTINPKLRFWWRAGTQQENTLYAQASTDNGKNWSTIWSWGSYWNNSSSWARAQIDLASYIAYTNVTLRFLAYNPVWRDLNMDFQIDDLRVDDAPLDVTASIGPGPDPRHSAQLNWSVSTASDFAGYAIYRSTSAGVTPASTLVTTISNKGTTTFIDTNLPIVSQTYYYRVIVWDTQGLHNWGTSDLAYKTAYGQVVTTLPFGDSFGGSDANWAFDLPWAVTAEAAHTGVSLGSNPGTSYANNTDASAYLNINLAGANRPMLSFWQRYGFEPDRDFGFVEVSLDQGASWARIYAVTSQSGAAWNKVQIDLGACAGSLALIRFRIVTDGANPYSGWFVDDVQVQDYGTVAMGFPFYDGMDTSASDSNWVASAWKMVPGGATSVSGYSWRCDVGNGYQPGGLSLSSALVLAGSINLKGAANPQLWFWWRAGVQQENALYAQVSTDAGKNWTTVWNWGSYWNNSATWTRVQVDLSGYTGYTNLVLRFLAVNPNWRDLNLDFQVDDIQIAPGGGVPAILTSSTLPPATLGFAYNLVLQATNGPTPYTWAVASNTLPPGMALDPVGLLNGSPTALGTYSFWLRVTASNGLAATKRFSLAVEDYVAVVPSHAAQTFITPGTNVINCQIENQTGRRLLSLVWSPTLPAGWTAVSVTGNGEPEIGPDGKILFQAAALTNTPLKFSYRVRVPTAQTTPQTIGGAATFLLEGMAIERTLPASPDPLVILARAYHSADCSTNWIIESTEASRVLAYWRAQAYHLDASSCDGYAPGSGDQVGALHSADYLPPAWLLNGTEANRVLAYWRAGCYRADTNGVDGFSIGCSGGGGSMEKGDGSLDVVQQVPLSYTAGGTVVITNRMTHSHPLASLLLRPSLPAGWSITQISGDGAPEWVGGELVWTAQKLPASPVVVTYVVQVPQGEQGVKTVENEVEYQTMSMINAGSVSATPTPAAIYPMVLRFTGIQRLANGSIKLDFAGAVDSPVRVQAVAEAGSSNWTTLTTLPNLGGAGSYTDTGATNRASRFYRLVSP